MKTKPLTYLLALTFLISGSTIVSAKQKFGDYKGAIYVRNYDGDTITFNLPNLHPIIGKNIRVRLNGIDTPEIKGICDKEKHDAKQARDMVGDILKDAEKITLKNMQRGNYFRIASDVIYRWR
jgi:endonuclease YncB( thermonuclease family)